MCHVLLCCFLFQFYIKPQQIRPSLCKTDCCFLFQFYIKPQHTSLDVALWKCCFLFQFYIKPQLAETTVKIASRCFLFQFYIKPQPHMGVKERLIRCFLFQFYIKPQPPMPTGWMHSSCFLFQFYIKPQQFDRRVRGYGVVSYFNSTSNHNNPRTVMPGYRLFLISILHQTTTPLRLASRRLGCFLFQFYIKPQPRICDLLIVIRLCGRMNGTNGA